MPAFREKALAAATGMFRKEIQRATLRCFGRWPGYLLAAWRRAVRRAEERAGWSEEAVRDSLGYRRNATLRRAIRLGQA